MTARTPVANSANQLTEYSQFSVVNELSANRITIGTVAVEGGTISGFSQISSESSAITKESVDSAVSNISGPLNSVQRSSGTTFLGSTALLYTDQRLGLMTPSITINESIEIGGNGILSSSSITATEDEAIKRDYLFKIKKVSIVSAANSVTLTSDKVYNCYLHKTSTAASGLVQDILPGHSEFELFDNSSFDFVYYYTGTIDSTTLYGKIIPRGNFLVYNSPLNAITVPTGNICKFKVHITTNSVDYYLLSMCPVTTTNITPLGLFTENFSSGYGLGANLIISPVKQTIIAETVSTTYTAQSIKQLLITRTGLSADTTDTFPVGLYSQFPGNGLVSFTVQNCSTKNLTVGSGTELGYTYGPGTRTIPSLWSGNFDIVIDGSTCFVYCTGIAKT